MHNLLVWVTLSASVLLGCTPDKSGETASESSSTTGSSTTGDVPTSTGSSTTGGPSLIESCLVAEPCSVEIGPDIATGGENEYDALLCAFTRLRDASAARVDLSLGGMEQTLIALGTAERAVLVATPAGGGEAVQRCTLAEAAFFQKCIDDGPGGLSEQCAFAADWYHDCAPEPAPMCPGE